MPPADFAMLPTASWREHDWVPVSVMIGEADKMSVCLNSPSVCSGQTNVFMLTLFISALHVHQGHIKTLTYCKVTRVLTSTPNIQTQITCVNTQVPWNLLYSVLANSWKKGLCMTFVKEINKHINVSMRRSGQWRKSQLACCKFAELQHHTDLKQKNDSLVLGCNRMRFSRYNNHLSRYQLYSITQFFYFQL